MVDQENFKRSISNIFIPEHSKHYPPVRIEAPESLRMELPANLRNIEVWSDEIEDWFKVKM